MAAMSLWLILITAVAREWRTEIEERGHWGKHTAEISTGLQGNERCLWEPVFSMHSLNALNE